MPSRRYLLRVRNAVALAALAVLLLRAVAVPAADLQGSGGIHVNGKLLSAERVWQEYRFQMSLRQFVHNRPAGEIDTVLFESVARQLVSRELLEQEALRRGHRLTEADRAEARRLQVEAWRGEQNFVTAARMMGVSGEYIVERSATALLRDKMAAAAVPETPPLGEAQLRDYYEGHRAAYSEKNPPLRYIFVARKEGRSAFVLYGKIVTAAAELRQAGKSYASLVAGYSEDHGAAAGGAVPEGAPGRPKNLKEGRLTSSFVEDEAGWHLYLRDIPVSAPFDQVRDRARRDELEDRRKRWIAGLLEGLMKTAQIERLSGPPPPLSLGAPHGDGSKP